MNYTRIYWLCFLGTGILLFLSAIPDLLAGGLGITAVLLFVGGAGMVVGALYASAHPEAADGPTEPNLVFWAMVLAFVLMFAGTMLQFV